MTCPACDKPRDLSVLHIFRLCKTCWYFTVAVPAEVVFTCDDGPGCKVRDHIRLQEVSQ